MKSRQVYIDELLNFKDKSVVKVITGVRRCGKSSVLLLFAKKLEEMGIEQKNIIQINFESLEYDNFNYKELYQFVKNKITNKNKYYLFLDEVQRVENWEKAVNSFLVDFNVDIYITGSNAYLLSSELATFLSGRFVEIKMLPLSFKEFLEFHELKIPIEDSFELYLKFGGFPSLLEYNFQETQINQVIEGIYSSVLIKDVLDKSNIKDKEQLEKIIRFLADNIGNINSPNKISNVLKNERPIASKTVENYISLLNNAFIFYPIERYDIKGHEYLKTLVKNYIVDLGLRNYLLGYRDIDRGHILENVIYFELLRRGYKVSIGKIYENEVDFIATKQSEKQYFQVSETIMGEETRNRELKPLVAIKDNYKKTILTMDKNFSISYDGINLKNIIEFLTQD